jgi:uncharacterized membrane protein YozB (DUF420 family)
MESLRVAPGFFGPSLLADITLVVQILFYLILSGGVVAQLLKNHKLHRRLQPPVVILNLLFIGLIMVPTFAGISGSLPAGLAKVPILVSTAHAILGLTAELVSIYCLLAGLKILPCKMGVLRYWMWGAYTTWTAAVIFGVVVYILFYTGASQPVAPPPPIEPQPQATATPEPLPMFTPTVVETTPTATRVVNLPTDTPTPLPTDTPTATSEPEATATVTPAEATATPPPPEDTPTAAPEATDTGTPQAEVTDTSPTEPTATIENLPTDSAGG